MQSQKLLHDYLGQSKTPVEKVDHAEPKPLGCKLDSPPSRPLHNGGYA
jgi:hypothetical protein